MICPLFAIIELREGEDLWTVRKESARRWVEHRSESQAQAPNMVETEYNRRNMRIPNERLDGCIVAFDFAYPAVLFHDGSRNDVFQCRIERKHDVSA